MGRESLRKEILSLAVEDVIAMFKRKRELDYALGNTDDSGGSWVFFESSDFVKSAYNPSKLGIKDADVKKAIDRAVQEGSE
ncbi:MAG: hypothetical protein E7Z64_04820 [Thermoplasmata archaeon]|nr:hypothetical protein [Thermoplasmata archaeon]